VAVVVMVVVVVGSLLLEKRFSGSGGQMCCTGGSTCTHPEVDDVSSATSFSTFCAVSFTCLSFTCRPRADLMPPTPKRAEDMKILISGTNSL